MSKVNNEHMLHISNDIKSIIKKVAENPEQEDPFYVCDVGKIAQKYQDWQEKMSNITPYYAVKCNDSIVILEVLAAFGCGFDCASRGEIEKVLSLGVHPDRIIFANPTKHPRHIIYAAATHVRKMTFDNECELYKIKATFPEAQLVLRIRCESIKTLWDLGTKHGCDPDTEAPRLLQIARKLDLQVIGVSFHVGSDCGEPTAYRRAISKCCDIFKYANSIGYKFHILDIGGGFPGKTDSCMDTIANVVKKAVKDYFPNPVTVIAEPGRYFPSSTFTLLVNAHSKKVIRNTTDGSIKQIMYYMNDGVFGSFPTHGFKLPWYKEPVPLIMRDGPLRPSLLWGPTCAGLDKLFVNIQLPELELYDWLVFEDMGAYSVVTASTFNGFPIPRVHFVLSTGLWTKLRNLLPHATNQPVSTSTTLSKM